MSIASHNSTAAINAHGIDASRLKGHRVGQPKDEYRRFLGRKMLFFLIVILSVVLLTGLAVTFGSANLSVKDVYFAILAKFLPEFFQTTHFADTIVWGLRLERILMGIVAGMGLSVAGAAMQGILKNPLASEFTLGVSSAACFGAALAIVMGAGFVGGEYLVIGNSFIFTLIASFAVYGLAKYKGITPETMILAGIAIMYLFSALTSFLQYVGHAEQVQEVVFWMMGSLGKASWEKLAIITGVLAICLPYLLLKSWDINAIGADAAGKQELSSTLTARARVVVDDMAQAVHSGEVNVPISQGLLSPEMIHAQIGEILAGKKPGRMSDDDITVFDSTGLAIQDVAVGHAVYKKALSIGKGLRLKA